MVILPEGNLPPQVVAHGLHHGGLSTGAMAVAVANGRPNGVLALHLRILVAVKGLVGQGQV